MKKKKKQQQLWSELERKLGYGEVCKSQGSSTYQNLPCLTNMNLYKPCDIKRKQTAVCNKPCAQEKLKDSTEEEEPGIIEKIGNCNWVAGKTVSEVREHPHS